MGHKLFRTPDYIRKEIDEFVKSEEIQRIIKESKIAKDINAITKNNPDLQNLLQLPGWLEVQYSRYDKVLGAVESAFKKMGKFLPPEPDDFMDWFFNKYALRGDLSDLKIEDHHFEEYHKERLKNIEPPSQWDGLFAELKSYEYIFTTKSIFHDAMEDKELKANADKILWLKKPKADAIAFQEAAGFTMKQFNKCFRFFDGKPFAANQKSNINRQGPLKTILDNYFLKKDQSK